MVKIDLCTENALPIMSNVEKKINEKNEQKETTTTTTTTTKEKTKKVWKKVMAFYNG